MPFTPLPANARLDELAPKQRAFVEAFIALDGRAGAEVDAALAIGLGNGVRDKAARSAHAMMRNKRVLSAIRAELADKLTSAAVLGVATLIDLARNGPPSVRFSAAESLINRGYGPVMSRSAVVTTDLAIEDYLAVIEEAERKGLLVNADYVEVENEGASPGVDSVGRRLPQ